MQKIHGNDDLHAAGGSPDHPHGLSFVRDCLLKPSTIQATTPRRQGRRAEEKEKKRRGRGEGGKEEEVTRNKEAESK